MTVYHFASIFLGILVFFGASKSFGTIPEISIGTAKIDLNKCHRVVQLGGTEPLRGYSSSVHLDTTNGWVFKIDHLNEVPDMEFADWIFRASGSQLYVANLPLAIESGRSLTNNFSNVDFPQDFLEQLEPDARVLVFKYIPGVHLRSSDSNDYPLPIRGTVADIARLVSAEAERIYNWVKKEKPTFRGSPVTAKVSLEPTLMSKLYRQERYNGLAGLDKFFSFSAGPKASSSFNISFMIGFGDINDIYYDGQLFLIDPH